MKFAFIRPLAGVLAVVVIVGGLLAGCDSKSTGEKTMKFVNIEQVIIDSGFAAQEKTHLEAVHQSLQSGATLAEEAYKSLPQDKLAQARQADANVLNGLWQAEQRAARNVVIAQVAKAAEQYRAAHKIDAIMPAQTALSYSKELDVSADLIAQLKNEKVNFGDLPTITQKAEPQPVPESADTKQ